MDEMNYASLILVAVIVVAIGSTGLLFAGGSTAEAVRGADTLKPRILSEAPPTATVGILYSYQMIVQADVPPLTYDLMQGPAGMTIDQNGLLTWVPTVDRVGQVNGEIAVLDAYYRSSGQTFTIYVDTPPAPPAH